MAQAAEQTESRIGAGTFEQFTDPLTAKYENCDVR